MATVAASAKLSDADRHFRRGVDLYDDGDMSAAFVEFARAYQIVPHYRVLYNLGQVAYQRQDYVQALDYFRRYLDDGHQSVTRERRRKVQQDIVRIEQRIGRLEITTASDDDGAEILIDNVRAGNAPLSEPIAANVGQRKVELIRATGQSVVHLVDVVGGETVRDVFEKSPRRLWADAATAERTVGNGNAPTFARGTERSNPSARRDAEEDSRAAAVMVKKASSPDKTHIPWLGWTAAGILMSGAAVTGGLAFSASRDLQQRRDGYPLAPGDLDVPERRARTLALTADGLLIGGLVATAVALYLSVRAPRTTAEAAAGP